MTEYRVTHSLGPQYMAPVYFKTEAAALVWMQNHDDVMHKLGVDDGKVILETRTPGEWNPA